MSIFRVCSHLEDVSPFYATNNLYLKPTVNLVVLVKLPHLRRHKDSEITTEAVQKTIKQSIKPEEFVVLNVVESDTEYIKFFAEVVDQISLQNVKTKLHGVKIFYPGVKSKLKVLIMETVQSYPSEHDWNSYFRSAKHVNELKPGERPDTLRLSNLPCKWFSTTNNDKPSEDVLKSVFKQFGEIRNIDIPILDPYRSKMNSRISGLTILFHYQKIVFEAFVQYVEYSSFLKAVNALRGMKLLHIDENGNAMTASITIDFDRTKHLSESSIQKRQQFRTKITEHNENKVKELTMIKEQLLLEQKQYQQIHENKLLEERSKKFRLCNLNLHRERIIAEKRTQRCSLLIDREVQATRLLHELISNIEKKKFNDIRLRRNHGSGEINNGFHADGDSSNDLEEISIEDDSLRKKLIERFRNKKIEKIRLKERKKSKLLEIQSQTSSSPLRFEEETSPPENDYLHKVSTTISSDCSTPCNTTHDFLANHWLNKKVRFNKPPIRGLGLYVQKQRRQIKLPPYVKQGTYYEPFIETNFGKDKCLNYDASKPKLFSSFDSNFKLCAREYYKYFQSITRESKSCDGSYQSSRFNSSHSNQSKSKSTRHHSNRSDEHRHIRRNSSSKSHSRSSSRIHSRSSSTNNSKRKHRRKKHHRHHHKRSKRSLCEKQKSNSTSNDAEYDEQKSDLLVTPGFQPDE